MISYFSHIPFSDILYTICWLRHYVDVYSQWRALDNHFETVIEQHFKQWTNVQELPYQQQ